MTGVLFIYSAVRLLIFFSPSRCNVFQCCGTLVSFVCMRLFFFFFKEKRQSVTLLWGNIRSLIRLARGAKHPFLWPCTLSLRNAVQRAMPPSPQTPCFTRSLIEQACSCSHDYRPGHAGGQVIDFIFVIIQGIFLCVQIPVPVLKKCYPWPAVHHACEGGNRAPVLLLRL